MQQHFWLVPYVSAGLGALVFLVALVRSGGIHKTSEKIIVTVVPFWIVLMIGLVYFAHHFNVSQSRGFLIGSFFAASVLICFNWLDEWPDPDKAARFRRYGPALILSLVGFWVAIMRLKLATGEISGALGACLATALGVAILFIAPMLGRDARSDRPGMGYSLFALLAFDAVALTTAFGCLRAKSLADTPWADMPALWAGLSALGWLIAAEASRIQSFLKHLVTIVILCACLAAAVYSSRILGVGLPTAGYMTEGIVIFGLLSAIAAAAGGAWAYGRSMVWGSSGLIALAAGCALSFAHGAGYSVGMFALGGATAIAWLVFMPDDAMNQTGGKVAAPGSVALVVSSGYAFIVLLMLHRILVLQAIAGLRAERADSSWDLFALSVGALLPLAMAGWVTDGPANWKRPIVRGLEWMAAVTLMVTAIGLVGGLRSIAAVIMGMALSQLMMGTGLLFQRSGMGAWIAGASVAATVSAILIGSILVQFIPLFQEYAPATRLARAHLAFILGMIVVVRLFLDAIFNYRRLACEVEGSPWPVDPESSELGQTVSRRPDSSTTPD